MIGSIALFYLIQEKKKNEQPFYKGMPNYFADELVVFDWNGNIIEAYRLDQPICNFGVDGTKNILYGTTLDGRRLRSEKI